MPSNLHERLLELFRNRSDSAPELLRTLDVTLPTYDQIRIESPNVNNLTPVEFCADLVLFLSRGARYELGIIVEVQLRRDERKRYSWPAYVANLRARHRCPVCLLVITVKESVARWARRTIDVGPGTQCTAYVVGPSNTPFVTEREQAEKNEALAVFSAFEHKDHPDPELARRILATALTAIRNLDEERRDLYFDFIQLFMKGTPKVLEDAMSSLKLHYEYDFVRRGVARGKAEGRLEIILDQLTTRFGPLPDAIQTLVRGASDAQLYAVGKRLLTAQTLEETLSLLD